MKIKTSELDGAVLDWAVAKTEGFEPFTDGISWIIDNAGRYKQIPKYSTDWAQGGEIIERERIGIKFYGDDISIQPWGAHMLLGWDDTPVEEHGPWPITADGSGPTPLIAAMRCFVVSKLGEEVEVPEEVLDVTA